MNGAYPVWGFVGFIVVTALLQLALAFGMTREGRPTSAGGESVRFLVGRSFYELLVAAIVAVSYQAEYLDWFWSVIVGSLFYTPLVLLFSHLRKSELQR
jgi:hypothetical protein